MSEQFLTLKWGSWKAYNLKGNEAAIAAMERYNADPVEGSAMMQHDTDTQKQALCDVIDALPDDADISNDWSGEHYTKDEAKRYVREYGTK